MPAEIDSSPGDRRPHIQVDVSAVVELTFALFLIQRRKEMSAGEQPGWLEDMERDRPDLIRAVQDFWQDEPHVEWVELAVLADRLHALAGPDPSRLIAGIEEVAAQDAPVPPLPSESPEVHDLVTRRLARLQESPGRRARYRSVVERVWSALQPSWEGGGRDEAEGRVRELRSRLVAGDLASVVPGLHLAMRERYAGAISGALSAGEILVVPFGLAQVGQIFLAIGDHVVIALGPRSGQRRDQLRLSAVSAAARFKVLGDPTRLAILGRIMHSPSTVTDLAIYFELAQPTVSAHVKHLRDAGLLESERVGASTTYRTARAKVVEFVDGALEEMHYEKDEEAGEC